MCDRNYKRQTSSIKTDELAHFIHLVSERSGGGDDVARNIYIYCKKKVKKKNYFIFILNFRVYFSDTLKYQIN